MDGVVLVENDGQSRERLACVGGNRDESTGWLSSQRSGLPCALEKLDAEAIEVRDGALRAAARGKRTAVPGRLPRLSARRSRGSQRPSCRSRRRL